MSYFIFRDVSSEYYGIIVESAERVLLPKKRDTRITIPGRPGLIQTGAAMTYDNIVIAVKCGYCGQSREELRERARAISSWLSDSGKLIFSDEPDKHYDAVITSKIQMETVLRLGKFTLEFNCGPFAYGKIITMPLRYGTLKVDYNGTAQTPCIINLTNTGDTTINGITILATRRV